MCVIYLEICIPPLYKKQKSIIFCNETANSAANLTVCACSAKQLAALERRYTCVL